LLRREGTAPTYVRDLAIPRNSEAEHVAKRSPRPIQAEITRGPLFNEADSEAASADGAKHARPAGRRSPDRAWARHQAVAVANVVREHRVARTGRGSEHSRDRMLAPLRAVATHFDSPVPVTLDL
jgi:hypothetical protein